VTETPPPRDDTDDTSDADRLDDLFESLLEDLQEGRAPDPDTLLPDRPDLRARVRETWAMACEVAGRRAPGRPVLGGYEILREIGRGGMGAVYLARHEQLGREVAIKILPQSLALSPHSKRRFLQEARALARLRHPHIVQIHRVVDDAEMLAFEMEFVDGPSLQRLLVDLRARVCPDAGADPPDDASPAARSGAQPTIEHVAACLSIDAGRLGARSAVEFFVRIAIRIARALGEVHRHGLVHRDVKPSNVLLRRDGSPVLADFGLARHDDASVSRHGAFAGTPIYAAPERLRDGDLAIDGRADVYSLGVTLFEAITLTPPWRGRSTGEILRHIESGRSPDLRRLAPDVPRDLQIVLGKAMEPELQHRYATADEFADELERLLALQPIRARPATLWRRCSHAARRHRRLLLAGLTGAVLVAAGLWPVIAEARAGTAARERARQHLRAARLQLLAPDGMQLHGSGATSGAADATVPAQVAALTVAAHEYEAAIAAGVPDDRAAIEHAVTRTAIWVRTRSPSRRDEVEEVLASEPYARTTDGLPPLALELANAFVRGAVAEDRVAAAAATAADQDRFAAGLLALLLGSPGPAETCWSGLSLDAEDQPLIDAALGLLYAADGFPERAFPRLFHATRAFPEALRLQLELADTALAMGDPEPARDWLRRAPPLAADSPLLTRHARLQADLLLASSDGDGAAASYRALLRADPADPILHRRLATLALQHDDLAGARRHLEAALRERPDAPQPLVDLARLCARSRDTAGYLWAARRALAALTAGGGSTGARLQMLEILRLGGLRGLHEEAMRAGGRGNGALESPWREPPPSLPPDRRRGLEDWLRVLAHFDVRHDESMRQDRSAPSALAAAAFQTAARYPRLLQPVPAVLRPVLLASWPRLHAQVLPRVIAWTMPLRRSLGAPLESVDVQPFVFDDGPDADQVFASAMTALRNRDGTEDLVVASTPAGGLGGSGTIRRYRASSDEPAGELTSEHHADIFGSALADLGDLDGDRHHDLAVGVPLRARTGAGGEVIVFSGRTHAELLRVGGSEMGFGVAIANLGDLDGDGAIEFAVGTSPELRNSAAQGTATIFSGRDGAVLRTHRGDRAGVWFGAALAAAGDVDGDGITDLVVGGNHGAAPGHVQVFAGRTGALLHTLQDQDASTEFGRRLAGIADLDGDGRGDLLVAAPGRQSPPQPGRVFAYSGRTGQRLQTLDGESPGDAFGFAICVLPAWDREQDRAVAIGAPYGGPAGGGYVRIFAGAGLQPIRTIYAPLGFEAFGFSLAVAADPLGTGLDALVIASFRQGTGCLWRFCSSDFSGPRRGGRQTTRR
jgi:serine/threonine protein kinase